jgi:hypothetical protein
VPPVPAPPAKIRFFAGLGVLGSLGVAPAVSLGGDLFAGLARKNLSLEVGVRGDLPASARPDGTAGVRTEALLASVRPCLHLGVPVFCAVASFETVAASSFNITAPRSATSFAGALGGRAGAEIPLGRTLSLLPYAEVLWMIAPPALAINGATVYSLSPVSADVGLAGIVRFP